MGPGPDGGQRPQGGLGPEGRLLHRRVQLGRQRGLDPDPQPGGDPAGEPGEHVRRPDHQRARQRSRASRRSTTRPGSAPTCGSSRIDSIQAAADLMAMKQAGCTKVAVANDKEAYGAGLAHADRAGEGLLRRRRSPATPGSTRRRPTSAPTRRRSRAREPTASSSPASSPTAPSRSPRTSTRRCRRPRSSAATASARTPTPARRRAASRPSIDPLIQCTVATQDLAAYPGGKEFLAAYKAKYGVANPDPYAIYGYEAMKLGLDTIAQPGRQGQQQGGRAEGAVRDQGAQVGARHLRVRQERRHDAEVLRPVQGRIRRRARCSSRRSPRRRPSAERSELEGAMRPSTSSGRSSACAPVPTLHREPWKPERFAHAQPARGARHARWRRSAATSGRWGLIAALAGAAGLLRHPAT